jgi:glycosyltransferase involved in cell wall biosynthesis
MVGCPLQNREKVIFRYLDSIENLDYPKEEIHLAFLVNCSTDRTLTILEDFKFLNEDKYNQISIREYNELDYVDNLHNRGDFSNFATLRNRWLNMRQPNDTHIFSVDSDVLLPSHALRQLLVNDKDVCSTLVDVGREHYNTFNWDNKMKLYKRCVPPMRNLNQIDVTCAVLLAKKEVFDAGVKWGASKQGEDIYFCEKAKENGFEIWNDGSIECIHLKWDKESGLWPYSF